MSEEGRETAFQDAERITRQFGAVCRAFYMEREQGRAPEFSPTLHGREHGLTELEIQRIIKTAQTKFKRRHSARGNLNREKETSDDRIAKIKLNGQKKA